MLTRADVGIAMGALGSDAAIEAADVVLMDDDPAKVSLAMRIARKCMRIVYENIVFALTIKGLFLLLGAVGIANMWWAVFADVGGHGAGRPQRHPDAGGEGPSPAAVRPAVFNNFPSRRGKRAGMAGRKRAAARQMPGGGPLFWRQYFCAAFVQQ